MSIEKCREEFEVWAEENLGLSVRRTPSGAYQSFGVYSAWEAWQASRKVLVVELPEHYQYDSPGEVIPVLKDCRAAIEAAGVKVSQ